ncbi:lipopolysaccharide biosynthesis protein [Psychrobacillus sp. L3]|uniref:lipopolysaccharide biosynthesis protein n=1 Tax=Psychrobacillus sp. L3 TaxID=3236891 RepID=UPI0036F1D58A
MFSQLKRLGADSLLYAFMNVGTKLIAFALFPFYTHYFPDPAEMGVLGLIDRNFNLLTFLVIFGTDSALAFYYFEYKDKETREKYVRSVMTFRLTIVLILLLVFFAGGDWLSTLLFNSTKYTFLFYIAFGTLFLDTIISLVLTILRYEFKTKRVVLTTVAKMLLTAIFSMLIIAFIWTSLEGVLIGRLISVAIIMLVIIKPVSVYIRPLFDWEILKKILIYATPLVPASLAFYVISNANIFLLNEYSTKINVGIYESATKFATFITLLTTGIQLAWRPFSMSMKDKESSPKLFSSFYAIILLAGCFGVLTLATIMPFVVLMLSENYQSAYAYVAPISIATFLNFYYLIVSTGIFYSKQTKHVSIAFGIAAIISIVLGIVVIPMYDIWGAVIAYVVPYCVALFLVFRKSQKLYYVPFSGFKMAWTIFWLIAATVSIVYIQVKDLNSWLIAGVWIGFIVLILLIRMDKYFVKRK